MLGWFVKHSQRGLGKINIVENNRLGVEFFNPPSRNIFAGYAFQEGYLTHSILQEGTICKTVDGEGEVLKIIQNQNSQEPYQYKININGTAQTFSESDLQYLRPPSVSSPFDLLFSKELGSFKIHKSRENLLNTYSRILKKVSGFKSLLSCRINLYPHQCFTSNLVLKDTKRRYILADEVGLGKTIEAGIIINDQLSNKPDSKILVLCPGALCQQWLAEISSKFSGIRGKNNIKLLDLYRNYDFNKPNLIISSFNQGFSKFQQQIVEADWDAVVVDEVHHLISNPKLYNFVSQLSKKVPCLLLLSAIPARSKEEEYLKLLSLLEPGRFEPKSEKDKQAFKKLYKTQNDLSRRLRRITSRLERESESEEDRGNLNSIIERLFEFEVLGNDEILKDKVEQLDISSTAYFDDVQDIVNHVTDNYRFNRRILKNRKAKLMESNDIDLAPREVTLNPYTCMPIEVEAIKSCQNLIVQANKAGLDSTISKAFINFLYSAIASPSFAKDLIAKLLNSSEISHELQDLEYIQLLNDCPYPLWDKYQELILGHMRSYLKTSDIEKVQDNIKYWLNAEQNNVNNGRVAHLCKTLDDLKRKNPNGKWIIFAGYKEMSSMLSEILKDKYGLKSTVTFKYNEDDDLKEKNVIQFKNNKDTWILISDETGGEGRNFQFVNGIIHFDNPWSIAKIEQRIGRIDRLGRTNHHKTSHSIVLYGKGSLEDEYINFLNNGVGIYERSISGIEFSLSKIEEDIKTFILNENPEDNLSNHTETVKDSVDKEIELSMHEAMDDEASFDRRKQINFKKIRLSEKDENDLSFNFANYFRDISTKQSVKEVKSSNYRKKIWRYDLDNVHAINLPTSSEGKTGLAPIIEGTFHRNVAKENRTIEFFSIGEPLFEEIIKSFSEQFTGRTYAISFDSPKIKKSWTGFELSYFAEPNLSEIQENIGTTNQAKEIFSIPKEYIYFDISGTLIETIDWLKDLKRELCDFNNSAWKDLSSDELDAYFIDANLNLDLALKAIKIESEDKAIKVFEDIIGKQIANRVKLIDENIRIVQIINSDEREEEIKDWIKLKDSILKWKVRLDSIGFLAIN
jgi:ATP-dependent helicase HepA